RSHRERFAGIEVVGHHTRNIRDHGIGEVHAFDDIHVPFRDFTEDVLSTAPRAVVLKNKMNLTNRFSVFFELVAERMGAKHYGHTPVDQFSDYLWSDGQ